MEQQLVPIGQFAALTRLSAKALRLYGENGLLPPAHVDPASGYRYYRVEQVPRARLIRLLRAVDMPLAEIGAFLDRPAPERLDEYARVLQARQVERERVLRYLRRVLNPEEDHMATHKVGLKEVVAQPYLSRTKSVAIAELEPFIVGTIEELMGKVEAAGPPFTLYHGEVNDETDGQVEVCVPTAVRQAGGGELPAGLVLSTTIEGAQTAYPEILSAYDAVADWAQQHGHSLDGPPREIYLSDLRMGEPERVEIAWPVR